MKTTLFALSLAGLLMVTIADGTPMEMGDSAIIAQAQLAASDGLVWGIRRDFEQSVKAGRGKFLFVARSSHEFSVDWVVWVLGEEKSVQAGVFRPGAAEGPQWLAVRLPKEHADYENLRAYCTKASGLIAGLAVNVMDEVPIHGDETLTFVHSTGGAPVHCTSRGVSNAPGKPCGLTREISLEIIRLLRASAAQTLPAQVPSIRPTPDARTPQQNGTPTHPK